MSSLVTAVVSAVTADPELAASAEVDALAWYPTRRVLDILTSPVLTLPLPDACGEYYWPSTIKIDDVCAPFSSRNE